jgi:O-antigen biosynthesis protein
MRVRQDPGYFAQLWKPHSVDAVSAQHLVADGVFLMDALASGRIPAEITLPCLGEWLGTLAARWQKRVVYSPFLGVRSRADWQGRWSPTAIAEFSEANSDLIQNTRLYSRHLGLSLEDAYLPVSRESRSTPVPPLSLAVAGKGAFA